MGNKAWTVDQLVCLLHARKVGRWWAAKCPAHRDQEPSLVIWDEGDGKAHFYCWAGCAWGDVAETLRGMGAVIAGKHGIAGVRPPPLVDERERTAVALAVWERAYWASGTLAERYLVGRGLCLPQLFDGRLVRFAPWCVRGGEASGPAMLVRMDGAGGDFKGIQRSYLDASGRRIDRRMLGPAGYARFGVAGSELHVCEGFESGLALWLGGCARVWALLSAGALARLPVLEGVEVLVVHGDNDASRTGRLAAIAASEVWRAAGRRVVLMESSVVGWDPLDEYLERQRADRPVHAERIETFMGDQSHERMQTGTVR